MSKIPLYGTTHVKVRAPFLSILMKNKCNLGRILDGLLDLLSRGQCQIKNKYMCTLYCIFSNCSVSLHCIANLLNIYCPTGFRKIIQGS